MGGRRTLKAELVSIVGSHRFDVVAVNKVVKRRWMNNAMVQQVVMTSSNLNSDLTRRITSFHMYRLSGKFLSTISLLYKPQ